MAHNHNCALFQGQIKVEEPEAMGRSDVLLLISLKSSYPKTMNLSYIIYFYSFLDETPSGSQEVTSTLGNYNCIIFHHHHLLQWEAFFRFVGGLLNENQDRIGKLTAFI